jgi:PAS domain S-box-containing protein
MSESANDLVQQILGAAGEGIYGLDCQGRMMFANQASTDILGWSIEDCIGRSAHEVHHHSHADGTDYPREECPIYAAFKDGQVRRVEDEVFWHADGRAVPVEYTSTPIWQDGKLNGAVVVFRDISERIKIAKQREEAYAEISTLKEQLELERDYLRDEIRVIANFGEIIGSSTQLQRTLEQVEAVAQTSANVLVLGESGVGKEMIARAIHTLSPRADRALVKVNCASIPKDLFESEFFGHVKGAFTGAHKDRIGRMQMADGGTLFLDEVAEIPVWLQSKLLRALQEHEFERVGDDKTVKVDLRVVAATNRNLESEIKAGRFREDLFYRLSVFPIHVPPLRARKEDILPLTKHLLEHICCSMGREPLTISRGQGELLQSLPWPGNIRELKNVLERAVILSKGSRLRLDLALPGVDATPTVQGCADQVSLPGADFVTDSEFRDKEKLNLIAALEHAGWRISGKGGAAQLLGIKPSTLSYRMKTLEIEKPADQ